MTYAEKIRTYGDDWLERITREMISDAFLDQAALKMLITSPRFQKMTVADAIKEIDINGALRKELSMSDYDGRYSDADTDANK